MFAPVAAVEVTANRNGRMLKLRVRDNGVGLRTGWSFERHAGIGLRNVTARLEHLYGPGEFMRIVPNPSGGVEVQLDLPLQTAVTPIRVSTEAAATRA